MFDRLQAYTLRIGADNSCQQCPSGFSIAAIAAILRAWGGHEGFENQYIPHISGTSSTSVSSSFDVSTSPLHSPLQQSTVFLPFQLPLPFLSPDSLHLHSLPRIHSLPVLSYANSSQKSTPKDASP
jgi:hypothetical protein